jgi:hypothetical protein
MSVQKFNSKTKINLQPLKYVIINSHVVQNYPDAEALGVWIYLLSKPSDWNVVKSYLREHFKMGINKINKIFASLSKHNLVKYRVIKDERGKISHFDIEVLNGEEFVCTRMTKKKKPVECTATDRNKPEKIENVHHRHDFHANGKQCTTYNRSLQIKDLNQKLLSASDDARPRFEEFWKAYPLKKNRRRAEKLWKTQKLDPLADKILADLAERLKNDAQWQNKQFIPHAATYLNGQRWEDEIVPETPKAKNPQYPINHSTKCTVPEFRVEPKQTAEERELARVAQKKAYSHMREKGVLK